MDTSIVAISAQAGTGLPQLLFAVKDIVLAERSRVAAVVEAAAVPVITLDNAAAQWRVSREGDKFLVTGRKIEKFAQRTDFDNQESLQRLRDIMRRMGILHKLLRDGLEAGQTIHIAGAGSFEY